MPQSLSTTLVHLIFSTKHREPLIAPIIHPRLHAYLVDILNNLKSPSSSGTRLRLTNGMFGIESVRGIGALTAAFRPFRAGMVWLGRVPRALPWADELWRLRREHGKSINAISGGPSAAENVQTPVAGRMPAATRQCTRAASRFFAPLLSIALLALAAAVFGLPAGAETRLIPALVVR
jgi:hypothetical protein